MRSTVSALVVATFALPFIAAACGSSSDGGGATTFADPTAPIVTMPDPDRRFVPGDGGDDVREPACAVTTAETQITPVHLIMMFDRSGSMGDTKEDPSYDPRAKWIPVTEAMKAFFSDPRSAAMSAQLTFFPRLDETCRAEAFSVADLASTPLPSGAFADVLDANKPHGETPTRAATTGALIQAKLVRDQHRADTTAVVLVTDGEPHGCGINSERRSDAEARSIAEMIGASRDGTSLYLIAVGPKVANADVMAKAGGTEAFHVAVDAPEQTGGDFLDAINDIRGQIARCDFEVPPPPDGRVLDRNKVNVELIGAGAVRTTVPYNEECRGGAGWHWNDAATRTEVLLCRSTCEDVKVTSGGRVEIDYACVDRPDVLR